MFSGLAVVHTNARASTPPPSGPPRQIWKNSPDGISLTPAYFVSYGSSPFLNFRNRGEQNLGGLLFRIHRIAQTRARRLRESAYLCPPPPPRAPPPPPP